MDAKDIRNLSEAYMEVYEEKSTEPDPFGRPGGKHGGVRKGGGYEKGYEAMKKKIKELEDRKRTNEQVDIYDIILSHLLDEGYAETVEAAEAIMVNMSEDWRESIVEDAGIVSGLVGLALGAKGALHAAKKTKRLRDYPKNFVKGIADPRTYVPNKKKDKGDKN